MKLQTSFVRFQLLSAVSSVHCTHSWWWWWWLSGAPSRCSEHCSDVSWPSLTYCNPQEETSWCLSWLVPWELWPKSFSAARWCWSCMRMLGRFTVRRSPAPGHGCILQSPIGRNLKHDLGCTSTDDTQHHPTPINFVSIYISNLLFSLAILADRSTTEFKKAAKQGGHTFTWFRHFAHIWKCFHRKVMFRNTFVPQDLDIHFTLDIINCDLRQFSQMRNYWHTQKMQYFVQTSWTSLKKLPAEKPRVRQSENENNNIETDIRFCSRKSNKIKTDKQVCAVLFTLSEKNTLRDFFRPFLPFLICCFCSIISIRKNYELFEIKISRLGTSSKYYQELNLYFPILWPIWQNWDINLI